MPNVEDIIGNVVEETIPLSRGSKDPLKIGYTPDVYSASDSEKLDQDNPVELVSYILRGVKYWNMKWRDTDDEPIPLEIEEMLKVPESVLLAVTDRLQKLKGSLAGKKR